MKFIQLSILIFGTLGSLYSVAQYIGIEKVENKSKNVCVVTWKEGQNNFYNQISAPDSVINFLQRYPVGIPLASIDLKKGKFRVTSKGMIFRINDQKSFAKNDLSVALEASATLVDCPKPFFPFLVLALYPTGKKNPLDQEFKITHDLTALQTKDDINNEIKKYRHEMREQLCEMIAPHATELHIEEVEDECDRGVTLLIHEDEDGLFYSIGSVRALSHIN